ncbi:MAG TPA: MarR family transcriptional regulator [Acidimicrobiia bacterium]|jgi:DNA-binding MarR family transcriptional regulator
MSASEPEPPPPLIGALMRMPVDAVRRRIFADLHAAGFSDLAEAHMAVLRYPGPQGRRPSDLAVELGMSKQAVNYLLGALEQTGYVRRAHDPDDKRSRRIELTDRGEAVRQTIRATVADIEAELATELGARAFEQLRALLVRLNDTEFVRGPAGVGRN